MFVDTETTGLDPAVDRIIEIGVVTVDGGAVDEWTTLLNPRTPRALTSRLLQEIGEERARSLPRFGEIARTLLQRVGDGLLDRTQRPLRLCLSPGRVRARGNPVRGRGRLLPHAVEAPLRPARSARPRLAGRAARSRLGNPPPGAARRAGALPALAGVPPGAQRRAYRNGNPRPARGARSAGWARFRTARPVAGQAGRLRAAREGGSASCRTCGKPQAAADEPLPTRSHIEPVRRLDRFDRGHHLAGRERRSRRAIAASGDFTSRPAPQARARKRRDLLLAFRPASPPRARPGGAFRSRGIRRRLVRDLSNGAQGPQRARPPCHAPSTVPHAAWPARERGRGLRRVSSRIGRRETGAPAASHAGLRGALAMEDRAVALRGTDRHQGAPRPARGRPLALSWNGAEHAGRPCSAREPPASV